MIDEKYKRMEETTTEDKGVLVDEEIIIKEKVEMNR